MLYGSDYVKTKAFTEVNNLVFYDARFRKHWFSGGKIPTRFLETVLKPLAGRKDSSFAATPRLFLDEYIPILAQK
jgi:hypothetical protein